MTLPDETDAEKLRRALTVIDAKAQYLDAEDAAQLRNARHVLEKALLSDDGPERP